MNAALEWMNRIRLTVNLTKTKYMTFGTRATLAKLGNINLIVSDQHAAVIIERYLGRAVSHFIEYKTYLLFLLQGYSVRMLPDREVCFAMKDDPNALPTETQWPDSSDKVMCPC